MSNSLNQALSIVSARRLDELHGVRQVVSPVMAQMIADDFRPAAEAVLGRGDLSPAEVLDCLFSDHLVKKLIGFPNLYWVHVVMKRVAASPVQGKVHFREVDYALGFMFLELDADRLLGGTIEKLSPVLRDELLADGMLLWSHPVVAGEQAPNLVTNRLFDC